MCVEMAVLCARACSHLLDHFSVVVGNGDGQGWCAGVGRARAVEFFAAVGEAGNAGSLTRSARHVGLALATTTAAVRRSAARILSLVLV